MKDLGIMKNRLNLKIGNNSGEKRKKDSNNNKAILDVPVFPSVLVPNNKATPSSSLVPNITFSNITFSNQSNNIDPTSEKIRMLTAAPPITTSSSSSSSSPSSKINKSKNISNVISSENNVVLKNKSKDGLTYP